MILSDGSGSFVCRDIHNCYANMLILTWLPFFFPLLIFHFDFFFLVILHVLKIYSVVFRAFKLYLNYLFTWTQVNTYTHTDNSQLYLEEDILKKEVDTQNVICILVQYLFQSRYHYYLGLKYLFQSGCCCC